MGQHGRRADRTIIGVSDPQYRNFTETGRAEGSAGLYFSAFSRNIGRQTFITMVIL